MKPLQAMVLRAGGVRHVQFRVVFARHGIPKAHTLLPHWLVLCAAASLAHGV